MTFLEATVEHMKARNLDALKEQGYFLYNESFFGGEKTVQGHLRELSISRNEFMEMGFYHHGESGTFYDFTSDNCHIVIDVDSNDADDITAEVDRIYASI